MTKRKAKKNPSFTERLIFEIKNSGFGNPEFAEKCEIGYSTLMNYLNKNHVGRVPEWDILLAISRATNKSVDWLLTGNQFENININFKEPGGLMKLKEEQISILKKYAEALEENKRLQAKIASYEKILTFCQPPVGVEERRICRMQYDKCFKETDLL